MSLSDLAALTRKEFSHLLEDQLHALPITATDKSKKNMYFNQTFCIFFKPNKSFSDKQEKISSEEYDERKIQNFQFTQRRFKREKFKSIPLNLTDIFNEM